MKFNNCGNRVYRSIIITVSALLFASFTAFATSMEVSGTVEGGQWDSDTVRVIGDIVLSSDSVLSIEPGVRVEFTGAYSFTVNGELRAVGTFDDPIIYTAQQPDDDDLRWKGIRLINAARDCQFTFCIIEHGWARGEWPLNCGGGLYLEGSSPLVSRCTIINNRADGEGGGVYGWFTTSTFQNNVIAQNHTDRFGGGIFLAYSSPNLLNQTIAHNFAGGWGGGIYVGSQAAPVIKNCILVYNEEDEELPETRLDPADDYSLNLGRARSSRATVSFCLINAGGDDPFAGAGNIIDVPGFLNVDTEPFDYHLRLDSPCIDAGDPLMNPRQEPDVLVNRINMGAYGGTEEAALSKPVIFNRLSDELNRPLDFGNVRVNEQSAQDVTIENHGHYRLIIEDLVFSLPSKFSSDSTENDNGDLVPRWAVAPIEPGENLKFSILFEPTDLRDYDETVEIRSNDDAHSPEIGLTGTGIDPRASFYEDTTITARDLEFGSNQIGEVHHRSLYVHNLGETNLRVTSVAFQANSEFDYGFFDDTTEVGSLTVTPGDSGHVRFSFAPSRPEPYDEPAAIRTNDLSMQVTLKGRGVGAKMAIETDTLFLGYVYFNGDQAVDTVWVYNYGDSALTVDQITFNDTVGAFSADLPQESIAQLDSGFIKVYFDPPDPNQDFESVMTIGSNYPIDHNIELSGRGMAEPGNYMFGHVSGVWSWSANSTAYIILDSVYVPAHNRLKIEAGARVLFEPGASFQADGEVRCAGTETDSIYFIPRDQSGTDDARWLGIELNRDDVSRLSYCVINNSIKGISIREASPLVEFCTISDNGLSTNDPEVGDGGGVYLENSGAHLASCLISANSARYGGGVFVLNSVPVITNCEIRHNRATVGGGIYLRFQAGAHIQSNLIHDNLAQQGGDGIAVLQHSSPYIVNNTITDNGRQGIYSAIRSIPALVNNIIWDNDTSIVLGDNGNALVSYCDIQDGFIGTENLDENPQFVGTGALEYYLSDGSPLIDRGNPEDNHRDWSLPPAKGTDRNDIGAYGGSLSGSWQKPVVNLTVIQNPAFPQWLDVYVTAFDTLNNPVCSAELNGREASVNLTELDPMNYHGSYEFDAEGSIFIVTESEVNGQTVQVGRTFELILINPNRVNSIRLSDGILTVPEDALNRQTPLLGQIIPDPIKPTDDLLFLTQLHSFSSNNARLNEEAEITFKIGTAALGSEDLNRLGVYRKSESGWQRLEGGFHDGKVSGKTLKFGEFAVAWDGSGVPVQERPLPESADLTRAFPNPFNQTVSVEYNLTGDGQVNLSIFDLSGRLVTDLNVGYKTAGSHISIWDGRSSTGAVMPSGVYFMRLETAEAEQSIKLMLVR